MYSPGLPLSMNERQQIVDLYECGWKICDISKKLCVTHSCVSKILNRFVNYVITSIFLWILYNRFRATGSVRPKDAKEGRQESPLVVAIREVHNSLNSILYKIIKLLIKQMRIHKFYIVSFAIGDCSTIRNSWTIDPRRHMQARKCSITFIY